MKNMLSIQKDAHWLLKKPGAWLLLLFAIVPIYNFPAYAADKVSLQLRWDHQFQFAGYYCAQWQGYYAEEGLEVTILPGVTDASIIDATKEVIASHADFGIGGADILKANEDEPLVVLATILQQSGAGFFALPGTDLQTPADFTRLRVARKVDDLIDMELQALLKAEGIDPSTVVAYPHQAGLDHLLNGGVEVIPGLSLSLPYSAALQGQPLIFMSSSDFGINFYGDSLFTTREFLLNNENLVKRFRRASLKGWQYALDHPRETAARIANELERTTRLPDALAFNMSQSKQVAMLTDYPIIDVGHINPARWQQMHGYLHDLGILAKEIDLAAFVYDPVQYELRRVEKWQMFLLSGVVFLGLCVPIGFFWNVMLKRKVTTKTAELKKSYAALQLNEERFRDFFENAGEGIFLVDNSWTIVDANSAAVEILGYSSRNELLGLTGYDLLHPEDIENIPPAKVVEKLEENETFRIERRFRCGDGTYLPVLVSIKFITGKERHHILFRDISQQRQAEQVKSARLNLIEQAPRFSTVELLQKIIDEAEALTESNIGFYHFLENDENTISLQAWSSNTVERMCAVELSARHYPINQAGVWADTIHKRKPLICNDYVSSTEKKGLPQGHAALERYLSVPVFRGGKIVAVLGIGNKKSDYVASDIAMVQQLADLAWELIEKSHAEEELRKSEEIFSNVFQNAPLLMSLSRIEDGRYYDVNDAFVEVTGYNRERVIGVSSVELGFLDADTRKMLQEKLDKTGRVRGLELTLKKADGTTMICDYSGIILAIGGRPLLLSIASDITYRRQMENELATQAENLNILFNAIPSVLILLDEQGRVEKINTEGVWHASGGEDALTGQLVGNSLRCIHAIGEKACGSTANCRNCPVHECFSRTLASGEPCIDVEGEMAFKMSDNTVLRSVLTASRLLVIGGEKKILLSINDITRLKETEKERHDLEVQLNQAQKLESIGRLAGGVAHDMNNLLAPIIGYGEMLAEDLSTEDPRRDSADQIVTAANKATVLIRQLLAFSRKQSLEFKPLNLNVLLRNFEKLIRRTIREDILISITLAPELPEIEGDAGQLEQVVMNLAVNAQDAMPDGGELEFITAVTDFDNGDGGVAESELQGKRVTLIVRDNGAGIDKEIVDHIFEPFFTTKEQDKGTGLGLASVYGIVRQHKGDIVVNSTAQQGTTFKMYFPIAHVQAKPEEMPERTGTPEDGYGTILVVEDDEGLRKMVVTILKRKGYTPLTAANGEEALALLAGAEVKIDLLLTDVVMPTMSGRKLALRVAKEYGDIKTLYMSGYNDEIMEYQDLDSTRERFIEKPFSMNALIEKVQEMLA